MKNKTIVLYLKSSPPKKTGTYIVQRFDDDPSFEEVYVSRDLENDLWVHTQNASILLENTTGWRWSSRIRLVRR